MFNNTEINQLQTYKFKQRMESNIIYFGDLIFNILLFPNGDHINKDVSIYLYWKRQNFNISKINIYYTLTFNEIGFYYIHGTTFDDKYKAWGFGEQKLSSNWITNLDSLSISLTFMVREIIDSNGERIPIHLWRKYICNDYTNCLDKLSAHEHKLNNENNLLKQELHSMHNILIKYESQLNELNHDIHQMRQIINNFTNENFIIKLRLNETYHKQIEYQNSYESIKSNIIILISTFIVSLIFFYMYRYITQNTGNLS